MEIVYPASWTESLNEAIVTWVYRKYCKVDFCHGWRTYEQTAQTVAIGYGQIQTQFHRSSIENSEDISMAQLLDSKDEVEFKKLLMANTIQIDAMYQLLVQKGLFTEADFLTKMNEVLVDCRRCGRL